MKKFLFIVAVVLGLGVGMIGSGAFADLAGLHGSDAAGFDFEAEMGAYGSPTPSTSPSVNPAPASNTHWGVHKDTGAMEKLTKKGNRFYDQAGNQINATKEGIKTYKYEELDKANKYAEKISAQKASNAGQKLSGGAKGTGTKVSGAGGAASKLAGAMRVGVGLYMTNEGANMVKDSFLKEGKVDATDALAAGIGGATAASGVVMATKIKHPVVVGVAIAAGALLGAGAVATRIATQNDCFDLTLASGYSEYACCHTDEGNTALSGGVWYDIGQATYCPDKNGKPQFGLITYCEQGGQRTKKDWLEGKLSDDEWSGCEKSFCDGYDWPEGNPDMKIEMQAFWKNNKAGGTIPCWRWECADPGYKRSGKTCVKHFCKNAEKPADDKNVKTILSEEKNAKGETIQCWTYETQEQKPEEKKEEPKKEQPKKQTCTDMYAKYPKRLACCKAGDSTKWSDPKDFQNDHCYCVIPKTDTPDDTKTWDGTKCIDKSEPDAAAQTNDQDLFKKLCNDWPSRMSNTESSLSNDDKTCTVKSTTSVTPDDFVNAMKSAVGALDNPDYCTNPIWTKSTSVWTSRCGTNLDFELLFTPDNMKCPEKQKFDAGTCVSDGNENDKPDDAPAPAAEEPKAEETPDESKGCYGWADPTLCDNALKIVNAHKEKNTKFQEAKQNSQ